MSHDRAERDAERAQREGPWRVAGSLVLIAFGITFGVALARLHWNYGGAVEADGVSQSFVLQIYDALGFVPSLYFFLLVTVWGLFAFFGASVRVALCRLAIAIVFVASFAAVSSLLGGNGGEFGAWISERLKIGIGTVPSFLILSSMSLMSLLLATDWFFFAQFRRIAHSRDRVVTSAAPARPKAPKKVKAKVDPDLARPFEPAEITGKRLKPIPIPSGPKAGDPAKRDAQLQHQALVDRALVDARQDLTATRGAVALDSSAFAAPDAAALDAGSLNAGALGSGAGSALLDPELPPAKDRGPVEADASGDEDDYEREEREIEERRLALRARREAARIARAAEAVEAAESVVDELEVEVEPDGGQAVEDIVDEFLQDGLHPDEELGLAGLLDPVEPFSDLEDDDLLAKAGEALEKQWQGGDVGFALPRPVEDDDEDRPSEVRERDELATPSEPTRGERKRLDPFAAEPDRGDRGQDGDRLGAARPWRDALDADGGRTEPGDSGDEEQGGEQRVVIDPAPSRRAMPEDAPDASDEPVTAEESLVDEEDEAAAPRSAQRGLFDFDAPEALHEGVHDELDGFIEMFDDDAPEEIRADAGAEAQEEASAPAVESVPESSGESEDPPSPEVSDEERLAPDLVNEAAAYVLTARRPTPSLLQRRLGVGGLEARRLLDRLAELGAVQEPADGGAWHPLVSYDDWTDV